MKSAHALRSALLFVVALMLCASAEAGLFRAYLASDGNDANPCNLAQPCRLLPAALAAVGDGGEIWMLDSANYNSATVVISKSVSILAVPGAIGSVVAVAGPAFSITVSGLAIALRNLVIVPLPPLPDSGATYGVYMTGASTLTIENSLIANLANAGVYIQGAGTVEIANTTIRNAGSFSVFLQDGASANITNTKILNSGQGGVVALSTTASTTTATVSDSIISGGGGYGALAQTTVASAAANVFLTRCTIQKMTYALYSTSGNVGSTPLIAVSSSMITNNTFGWYIVGAPAAIRTLGNNHLTDNSGSNGSLTTSALQ